MIKYLYLFLVVTILLSILLMGLFGKKKKDEATFSEIKETVTKWEKKALHLVETHDRRGFSKMGGPPLVPKQFEWPVWKGRSLSFLMQLKFSEINKKGEIGHLPTSGLMYVFYDEEQEAWGFDPEDKGSWRILFYPETEEKLTSKHYPKDITIRFKEKMLVSVLTPTYPPMESDKILSLDMNNKQSDEYYNFKYSFFGNQPRHQLAGYPEPIQNPDMELECELASNGLYCGNETGFNDPRAKELEKNKSEWVLLLQIDTDDDTDMMWGDCGMLYFWIKKTDLANLNFNYVWMISQCG